MIFKDILIIQHSNQQKVDPRNSVQLDFPVTPSLTLRIGDRCNTPHLAAELLWSFCLPFVRQVLIFICFDVLAFTNAKESGKASKQKVFFLISKKIFLKK